MCVRDKDEDLCWMPVVFGVLRGHCITHRHDSKAYTNSSAAGNLYQARMGPNSNTKTPETHNLYAQTSSNCFEKKGSCHTMVNMSPFQPF